MADTALTAFLDGFSIAGLFGSARRRGAPDQVFSPSPLASQATIEIEESAGSNLKQEEGNALFGILNLEREDGGELAFPVSISLEAYKARSSDERSAARDENELIAALARRGFKVSRRSKSPSESQTGSLTAVERPAR